MPRVLIMTLFNSISAHAPGAAAKGDPLAGLPLEIQRIRKLIPLRRVADEEFAALVQHARVERRAAGQALFRAGFDDEWLFYLLDGEVEISDDKGFCFVLEGGSIETAHPLTPHHKARVLATITRDACYVRMPAALLNLQAAPRVSSGVEVEELCDDSHEIDSQLLFAVSHALMDGSFALPTLPDIALRIRDAAQDPGKGVADIVRLVQADAVIAAYCLKVANSAAYVAATPATGVQEAVMRMGVAATRDLITAFTLKDLFSALDRETRALMRQAWQHSSRIAALSYVIARHSQRLNAEQALLAGLVHDIGMLVLLREWPLHAHSAIDPATMRVLARDLNGAVGSMVLRAWHFPDSIVTASLHAEHWTRAAQDALDLSDCIVLAHAHDNAPPPWSDAVPAIEHIAAYRKLSDGSLSPSRRLLLVEQAEQQLRDLHDLLGA
jgi:HD-like signal output (HDOD) protein